MVFTIEYIVKTNVIVAVGRIRVKFQQVLILVIVDSIRHILFLKLDRQKVTPLIR